MSEAVPGTGTTPTPAERALRGLRGMRVAQLIESDGPGGAERVFAHLTAALRAHGAEVVAFVKTGGEGWLEEQLRGAGVTFVRFRFGGPFSPAFARWLADSMREHRVDVAHSHEFGFAVYGAWAARLAGIGHIITMHGGRYYAEHLRRRVALRMAAAASHRIVAVSEPVREHLQRDLMMPRSSVDFIPNGIPFQHERAPTLRAELGLGDNGTLALAIGNLYPVKGHAHLIDALGLLAVRHPGLHVAIAGRGDLEGSLRQRAISLGIADRVHFLGLRSDVPNLLASADLFVLPSLSEGLPLALLEAMFAGRAIVSSEVGGVAAVLDGGNAGLLVPPGDAGSLATSMERVLNDRALAARIADAAGARARADYGIDRMVARYAERYTGAAGPVLVRASPE